MKIVLVDDDPTVLTMLSKILQRKGHEVLTYSNPLECPVYASALGSCTLEDNCPDIIISDVDMPKVNGLKFIEAICKKGCRCKKLALISGKGLDRADLDRMANYGISFFTKPLNFNEFNAWMMGADRLLA
ncbi:MAG: response regulator [bacterium]|jgi:DNA-binding response OmpR family regulator